MSLKALYFVEALTVYIEEFQFSIMFGEHLGK